MKTSRSGYCTLALTLLLTMVLSCQRNEEKAAAENKAGGGLQPEKIPQAVMGALKTRFPKAEIQKWTREREGEIVIYDIEFTQEGRKFEADIKADGAIHNWEKAIEIMDLPEAVRKSVETKYPQCALKEIMEITAVADGKDLLEGYEIVLETADKKVLGVTAAPDGRILEDSGEKQ